MLQKARVSRKRKTSSTPVDNKYSSKEYAFAYFNPNKESTTHKCKVCDGVLSQVLGSGYSNLEQHTRLVHGKDRDVVVAAYQEAKNQMFGVASGPHDVQIQDRNQGPHKTEKKLWCRVFICLFQMGLKL